MRTVGVAQRRARLAAKHLLAPAAHADDPPAVAAALVALHATDPASVYLSVFARTRAAGVAAVERALYDDREVVRMLGMRRTVFVVPRDAVPVVAAACTRAIAERERRLLVDVLTRAAVADDVVPWLGEVEEAALRALAARGEATAAELAEDEPLLRTKIVFAEGKKYEGVQSVSTRVLFVLAADGRIVRGRPRGSWISSQYRWARTETWLPDGLPDWPADDARVELARRWLTAFGPATVDDLRWWAGWTLGQTRKALGQLTTVEVDLDGRAGVLLADDTDPPAVEPGWAALLPALDPTPMGWADRGWFLGDHAPALFDRTGNIGPSVWYDGRIVGGWAQRRDGEIALRLLEDVGADAVASVEAAANRLRANLGAIRVTPRFRTPLEKELSA